MTAEQERILDLAATNDEVELAHMYVKLEAELQAAQVRTTELKNRLELRRAWHRESQEQLKALRKALELIAHLSDQSEVWSPDDVPVKVARAILAAQRTEEPSE